MYIVQLALTSGRHPRPTQAEADRVQDTVWAHAHPLDGLDHVRSRAGPDRIDLVLFLREPDPASSSPPGLSLTLLTRLLTPLTDWNVYLPADM